MSRFILVWALVVLCLALLSPAEARRKKRNEILQELDQELEKIDAEVQDVDAEIEGVTGRYDPDPWYPETAKPEGTKGPRATRGPRGPRGPSGKGGGSKGSKGGGYTGSKGGSSGSKGGGHSGSKGSKGRRLNEVQDDGTKQGRMNLRL